MIFAPEALKVSVLEVGKKESVVLVRSQNNASILIDTGPDASILRALGRELPPWQRSIDTIVLTNATPSSAGGLPEVLSRYRVSNLIRFGPPGSKSIETALREATSAEIGLRQIPITQSQRIALGDNTYIDIIMSSTGVTNVYLSKRGVVTQLK